MRAAVMWEAGGPFEIRDAELAKPGPREVVVRIHAAGVCASDLALTTVFGQPTPVVLGHEGAGVVSAVGSEVSRVALGDRVLVLWVAPCGQCKPCLRGDEYLCANRSSTADARAGKEHTVAHRLSVDGKAVFQGMKTATFAEETLLPENALVKLPDDVPFDIASMLGCAVPTGVGAALRSAKVQPGDAVAVIGCGAVGLNALLGSVIAGAAELIAVDPMPERGELARSLGATRWMTPEEFGDSGKDGGKRELDVVIDAVGSPTTVLMAWRAVRRAGTVTVVGAGAPGAMVQLSAYELFHDDKKLTGSFHGGISLRRDLGTLVSLWRSGRLPIERLMRRLGEARRHQPGRLRPEGGPRGAHAAEPRGVVIEARSVELLICRHGLPLGEAEAEATRKGSGVNPDLSAEGHRQAALLATALARGDHGQVTAIVCSPMPRAQQTARPLADRSGLPVHIDDRLAELDDGVTAYGSGFDMYPTRQALWAALNEGRWGRYPFDRHAFQARVVAAMEAVVAAHPEGKVAVICHGGVINAYLSHVLAMPTMFFFGPDCSSVTRVLATGDGHRELLSVNEKAHLLPAR